MISNYKKNLSPFLEKLALPFLKISPNMLSFFGFLFCFLFFFALIHGYYTIALASLIGGAGLDFIDGAVARLTNKVSDFGGVLDSVLDRASDFLLISAFGFAKLVPWEIILPVLLMSFLISYIRSRAEQVGGVKKLTTGIIERAERVIFIFIIFILFLIFPNFKIGGINLSTIIFTILLFSSFITVLQRLYKSWQILK